MSSRGSFRPHSGKFKHSHMRSLDGLRAVRRSAPDQQSVVRPDLRDGMNLATRQVS